MEIIENIYDAFKHYKNRDWVKFRHEMIFLAVCAGVVIFFWTRGFEPIKLW